jgi:hypothetical protein
MRTNYPVPARNSKTIKIFYPCKKSVIVVPFDVERENHRQRNLKANGYCEAFDTSTSLSEI